MAKYFKSFIEYSKEGYGRDTSETNPYPIKLKQLKLGALERQAEALERQAKLMESGNDTLSDIRGYLDCIHVCLTIIAGVSAITALIILIIYCLK